MSVVIYTKNEKIAHAWKVALQDEMPDQSIEIYPSVTDFKAIEVLICWKPFQGLIAQFPNLKAIQSLGAGVDHIFESNTIDSNIQVSKIVDHQLTQDMWEHVLSVVLSDMKNLETFRSQQREQKWKMIRYKSIKDVKIGVLGLGSIGSFVAYNFAQLGFEVLGWSGSDKQIDGVKSLVGDEGLETVSKHSDYLINILPLTKETTGILNQALFSKMKPEAFLINVGRGKHLVDRDLVEALENSQIRGASLDVFQEEPLPTSHVFWTIDAIQITPHIASLTYIDTVYPQVVENIQRLDANLPLLNTINTGKGY